MRRTKRGRPTRTRVVDEDDSEEELPETNGVELIRRWPVEAELVAENGHKEDEATPERDEHAFEDDLEIVAEEGRRQVRQGRTTAKDVWTLGDGEKIVVECNRFGQPIKKGSTVLTGYLGIVTKIGKYVPIHLSDWRSLGQPEKESILGLVRSKFLLPICPKVDKWILQAIGHKRRDYRHELKTRYKLEGLSREEVASAVPPEVVPDQWVPLVHHWFTDTYQKKVQKAIESRKRGDIPHTSGSKSYARARAEFEMKHGREPGRIEFFDITHKRKDGTYVNEIVQQRIKRAKTLLAGSVGTSEHSSANSNENDIFNEVMGIQDQRPRILGYGHGITLREVFGSQAQTTQLRQQEEIHRLKERIKAIEESYEAKLKEKESKLVETEAKLSETQSQLASVTSQLQDVSSLIQSLSKSSMSLVNCLKNLPSNDSAADRRSS